MPPLWWLLGRPRPGESASGHGFPMETGSGAGGGGRDGWGPAALMGNAQISSSSDGHVAIEVRQLASIAPFVASPLTPALSPAYRGEGSDSRLAMPLAPAGAFYAFAGGLVTGGGPPLFSRS